MNGSRTWRFICVLSLLIVVFGTGPAVASPPKVSHPAGVFSGSVAVTSIEMIVRATDARGRPLSVLHPGDISVLEDGKPVKQVTVTPLIVTVPAHAAETPAPVPAATPRPAAVPTRALHAAKPAPVVTIYFQNDLLDRGQMAWAIKGLKAEAGKLTALGPVRIVVADPAPHVVADGLTDPALLSEALDHVKLAYPVHQRIDQLRRDFYRNIQGVNANMVEHLAFMAARQEEDVVRRTMERLESWTAGQPRHGGRILLLVSGGFDLDPFDYYRSFVRWGDQADLRKRFEEGSHQDVGEQISVASMWEQISQALAGSGWTVVGFTGGMGETDTTASAEASGANRAASFMGAVPQGMTANAGTLMLHPVDPLREAAQASGGAVAVTPDALTHTLSTFIKAYVVAYTVDRAPDGKPHTVKIVPKRAGIVIHAPHVVRSITRTQQNKSRALAILDGHPLAGSSLHVQASITGLAGSPHKGYRGRLVVKTNMAAFLPLFLETGTPRITVTIAVDTGKGIPFVTEGAPLPLRLADRKGDWIYESPMQWPAKAKKVAVVIDEVTTDIWGGIALPLPHRR